MSPSPGNSWNGRTLLVFGGTGQIGQALAALPPPDGWRIIAASRAHADITCPDEVRRFVARVEPDVIVNAAAFTAVDDAESHPAVADQVNCQAAGHVAAAALEIGAPIIHLSTDYVFDGRKLRPLHEDHPVAPLNVYGATKEAGERLVRRIHAGHVILRTSWVFGAHGRNFVRTMLRLGAERRALRIVADQRGCPTAASDVARALWRMACAVALPDRDLCGTFHFAGAAAVSWFDFARAIFAEAERHGYAAPELIPIATAEYPTPARRPVYSVLDCRRIRATYGIAAPDWQTGLADSVAALLAAQPETRSEGAAA